MKQLLFTLFLFLPTLLMAQTSEIEDDFTIEVGCRSVYYGTEASTHPNNPCKGATTRKCAEIDTELKSIFTNLTRVVTMVKDAKGAMISIRSEVVDATPDEIIDDLIMSIPPNAVMTHVRK